MGKSYNWVLERIDTLCKKRNWSMYRLAKEADIPYTSISNMYSRDTQPTISTLKMICTGLGITLSDFFSEDVDNVSFKYTLSDEEYEIIDIFRTLDANSKMLFKIYLSGLARLIPKDNCYPTNNSESITCPENENAITSE